MKNNTDTSEFFTHYPHIARKVQTLWGTKECRELLMSLLNDSRDGKRAGFPLSIGKIIITLLQAHDNKFPQFDDKEIGIIPFTGVRPRPVVVSPKQDWGIVGTAAKLIAFVLISLVCYKLYKYF